MRVKRSSPISEFFKEVDGYHQRVLGGVLNYEPVVRHDSIKICRFNRGLSYYYSIYNAKLMQTCLAGRVQ